MLEANSLSQAKRFFKSADVANVSDEGLQQLAEAIENYGLYIAKFASEIAQQAGRKEVDANDVRLAFMNVSLGRIGLEPGVQYATGKRQPPEKHQS